MPFTLTKKKNKSISALSAGSPSKTISLTVSLVTDNHIYRTTVTKTLSIKSNKHTPSENAARHIKIIVLSECYRIRSIEGHYTTTNILDNNQ